MALDKDKRFNPNGLVMALDKDKRFNPNGLVMALDKDKRFNPNGLVVALNKDKRFNPNGLVLAMNKDKRFNPNALIYDFNVSPGEHHGSEGVTPEGLTFAPDHPSKREPLLLQLDTLANGVMKRTKDGDEDILSSFLAGRGKRPMQLKAAQEAASALTSFLAGKDEHAGIPTPRMVATSLAGMDRQRKAEDHDHMHIFFAGRD